MAKAPFEQLFVVAVDGKDSRIYTKLATAKSQITRATDFGKHNISQDAVFSQDCSLWSVGESGWELLFAAKRGESAADIPWKTALSATERRIQRYREEEDARAEANDRELYEVLRLRFEAEGRPLT